MPRTGITYDEVAAAADAIAAEDKHPTVPKVRERLGTGSSGTIHQHLSAWRAKHQQVVTTSSVVPQSIIDEISREISRAQFEARAEIEERLVITQSEAVDLAAAAQELEAELDSLKRELEAVVADRDRLQCQVREQTTEIDCLKRENERERFAAEQARIETAQKRNETTSQAERICELSVVVEGLKVESAAATQAKVSAERDVAVLSVKLELEQEATARVLYEKDALISQLKAELQTAENGRLAAASMVHAYQQAGAPHFRSVPSPTRSGPSPTGKTGRRLRRKNSSRS